MPGDARATTFITGADGFVGTELVRVLVARGHHVRGLTPSADGAQRLRRAGAVPEDEVPRPPARERCFTPALDRLDGYIVSGLPIVTAFPGWVYGNASWFRERVIEPVMGCRHVLQFGKTGPWVSPIHVHDCARALVHLAEHGDVGRRYFVVNNDPIRLNEFAGAFARLANRPLRVWRMPAVAARLVACPLRARGPQGDAVFSNIRLRELDTRLRFAQPHISSQSQYEKEGYRQW